MPTTHPSVTQLNLLALSASIVMQNMEASHGNTDNPGLR